MPEVLDIYYDNELELQEQQLAENDDYNEIPPSDIVAFNELRSCADIVRMYLNQQLKIDPDFQRDIVWSNPGKTRFIDSLIKELPIPSMCISFDYKTNERLVIDGLQRISSIISFLTDEDWRLSKLRDIDPKISGKTVGTIKTNQPLLYDRVENLTIPITVLRCDYSKKNHMKYLFTIFHRLNTGGNKLTNQEIRNCIYGGALNDLLKELAQYDNFRNLLNLEEDKSYRFAYEELILRMFAFHERLGNYTGRLANFLNDYMESNRNIGEADIEQKRNTFFRVVDIAYSKIRNRQPFDKMNKTTIEGVLVGILANLNELETESDERLGIMYNALRVDEYFSIESLRGGLSNKDNVLNRLRRAIDIFNP